MNCVYWLSRVPSPTIAGVVVVEQVIGVGSAIGLDGRIQRLQIVHDRGNAGLADVTAIAVAAAGVAVLIVVVVGSGLGIGIFNLIDRRSGKIAVAVAVRQLRRRSRT